MLRIWLFKNELGQVLESFPEFKFCVPSSLVKNSEYLNDSEIVAVFELTLLMAKSVCTKLFAETVPESPCKKTKNKNINNVFKNIFTE